MHRGKFRRRPKMQALETLPLNGFSLHQWRLKRKENFFIPNCSTIPILLVTYDGPIIVPESREIKIVTEFLPKDCCLMGFIDEQRVTWKTVAQILQQRKSQGVRRAQDGSYLKEPRKVRAMKPREERYSRNRKH